MSIRHQTPLGLAALLLVAPAATAEDKVDFNQDIRPIISDKCFKCHGPDARNQKSDFRLDTRENAIKDLGGYAGITPGDLDLSDVHHLIRSDDPDERMPPPKSKMSLTEKEKDLLDRWIEQGAPYDTHWAFKPIPTRVPVPKTTNWARNRIDAFILDRSLEGTGLKPNKETTPEKWLRRVTFDHHRPYHPPWKSSMPSCPIAPRCPKRF